MLDADEAEFIEATVDDRKMAFHRVAPRQWRQTEPVEQDAAREEIRTMLGRTGALKAFEFAADDPSDLSVYGLEPPQHKVRIGLSSGEVISLWVGEVIPDTDPQQRYIYRVEDKAVYASRDGFLEAFQHPVERYRKRKIIGKHEWDVQATVVTRDGEEIRIDRTSDGWRWPDGAPVPGSTPKRLAGRAAEIEAIQFFDEPPETPSGLDPPWAEIILEFDVDNFRTVWLGEKWEEPSEDEEYRTLKRQFAQVDGSDTIYGIDGALGSIVDDLFREYNRKIDRDAETKMRDEEGLEEDRKPEEGP